MKTMRILPLIVGLTAGGLCVSPAHAQQRVPASDVHCEAGTQQKDISAKLEAKCLSQMKGLASRSGDKLRLVLNDGRIKTISGNSRACQDGDAQKCLEYRLAAYYPAEQLFVIDEHAYESSGAIVVNAQTGAITRMEDRPRMAPGRERLVVAFSSEAWEVKRDIAVYKIEPDAVRLEWSYKAKDYEMWELGAWDVDDRIKLRVTLYAANSSGKSELTTQDAELLRTSAGWRLNKQAKKSVGSK